MMLYAIGIGAAIAAALIGIQTWRLHSCQAGAAAVKAQVTVMGAQISEQNRAVEKLASDGAAKQATAAAALRKAEGKAKVWDADAKRLRDALANRKPADATDCKAAWQELRK